MTNIIKKTGLTSGLIFGAVLILIYTYIHLFEIQLLLNVVFGLGIIGVTIVFGIVSIVISRRKLNGQITFKEAFSSYFITILVGNILACLCLILLYEYFISTETKETLKQSMIDFNINLKKQNLATEEEIKETLKTSKSFNPFHISEVITGYIKYLLRDCLFGFLIALIFRNKKTT